MGWVLAFVARVLPILSAGVAAAVSLLWLRERRARRGAERLGAATLETLLNAIDANDAETGAHVRRVAEYSLILADAAGADAKTCRTIERVALFHDIGKIHEALFDILHDTDKLTPEERRAVMTHPQRGSDVLDPLDAFYPELRDGVITHHERWDGTGYPRGLAGRRIPLSARVVAIADAFDAITHHRRYEGSRSVEEAVAALAGARGTQFDPALVDLFLSPLVLAEVTAAMERAHETRGRGTRRRQKPAPSTPDVTFRWRTGARGRQLRDRKRRR